MTNINYTIAVMIYNVEKFLRATIDSCIKQSGSDIEILLIDDGSTDHSGTICDEYAKKDSRVVVIHQKNSGVSSARNTAINNAKGKWLILVDGDDVLTEQAIEHGRKYINDDSDLLQFDAVTFVDTLDLLEWRPKGKELLLMGDELKDYHMQLIDRSKATVKYPTYNMNPAWAKIWNMDFIKKYNLRYDEKVHKGEGTLFTFSASYVMQKVRFVPEVLYGYRLNPTSIMHRFSPNILEMQDIQYIQYYNVIEKYDEFKNDDISNALKKRGLYLIENAIHLSIAHPDCNWNNKEQIAWTNKLYAFSWVKESAKYGQQNELLTRISNYISNNNISAFVRYCNCLKLRKLWKLKIEKIIGNNLTNCYRRIRYGKIS